MEKGEKILPPRSMGILIVCGAVIVVLILVGVLPLYRYNTAAKRQVQKLQYSLEEQKGLGPVYQALTQAQALKIAGSLPDPPAQALSFADADSFSEVFRTIAGKSGLMTVSLAPDIGSFSESSRSMIYSAVVKGEYANFRRMLIGLGAVAYVDRIEEISMRQYSDSMEFRLKIRIALKG